MEKIRKMYLGTICDIEWPNEEWSSLMKEENSNLRPHSSDWNSNISLSYVMNLLNIFNLSSLQNTLSR